MTSLAEPETEQRMLEEIVRQVKKANPTLTWLDELDTTSVRSFKQCYARGEIPAARRTVHDEIINSNFHALIL